LASVVDVSVVAKWYLRDEQLIDQAMALLETYRAGAEALICPHFARYELANAVARAARLGRISTEDAVAAVRDFTELGIADETDADDRLMAAASLADRFRVSLYDALYLALADESNVRLVTADRQLCDRTAGAAMAVTHLADLR
jgi:predicted nucleic acid-binding protein